MWSAEEDDILYRCMQYLKAHPTVGITMTVCHMDFQKGKLYLDLWTDADHAGDAADAKSCSGWCLLLRGERSRAALDAVAKKQTFTAKSTPDAEITSVADGVVRSSAVAYIIFSQIWGRRLSERVHCDNTAGVSAVKAGMSKKLSYMRRTQRVSIGSTSDYIYGDNGAIIQEATADQPADVFTEPLAVVLFWKCLRFFGIG